MIKHSREWERGRRAGMRDAKKFFPLGCIAGAFWSSVIVVVMHYACDIPTKTIVPKAASGSMEPRPILLSPAKAVQGVVQK